MRTSLVAVILCLAFSVTVSAASIQLVQNGWSTDATLSISFSGQDADSDGAITQSELTAFDASWASPLGYATTWALADIEPDGFFFTDLDNYLFFTENADFSLLSTAFEGEVLASVFDAFLFPVDSTATPPRTVPEPGELTAAGLIALEVWRRLRLAAIGPEGDCSR